MFIFQLTQKYTYISVNQKNCLFSNTLKKKKYIFGETTSVELLVNQKSVYFSPELKKKKCLHCKQFHVIQRKLNIQICLMLVLSLGSIDMLIVIMDMKVEVIGLIFDKIHCFLSFFQLFPSFFQFFQ